MKNKIKRIYYQLKFANLKKEFTKMNIIKIILFRIPRVVRNKTFNGELIT